MSSNVWPDRKNIESDQLAKIRRLLDTILPSNAFYARKLGAVPPAFGSLAEFSQAVEFTTKHELVADQAAHPPYGTNLTYDLAAYTRLHQTSATTGTPLRWLDTPESWSWMLDCWDRVYDAADATARDHALFAFSFGPFLGFWTAFESAARRGMLCVPAGGLSSAGRLRAIIENSITVLCCTPTYAIHLGEVATQEGINLSACVVRAIIVAGEPGGSISATRSRIEALWPGAKVHDHHGLTEVGPVTYACPARPDCLHVIEDAYYPEIVDPQTLQHVEPETSGELVLTNLGRTGSPLLRYRTGDLVKSAPVSPCACGSHELALEGGILGRTDDMVVVRGVNIYPSAVEAVVRGFAAIAEYRVHVLSEKGMTELMIDIEPAPDCAAQAALAKELESALKTAFALRIPVNAVAPKSLPRFELKARRWIRS